MLVLPRSTSPAHPRTGGENSTSRIRRFPITGSSPHGRGKRNCSRGRRQRERLIPARAGKTTTVTANGADFEAHPRTGGENEGVGIWSPENTGSSPHGRGKLAGVGTRIEQRRLIPARAGKTRLTRSWACSLTAHPRTGGENDGGVWNAVGRSGSSPHGRGKPRRTDRPTATGRLIPARAGKTSPPRTERGGGRAHPRTGGENRCVAHGQNRPPGSSPHGRGKHDLRHSHASALRLIPARAGKTRCSPTSRGTCTAHPRTGGENSAPASAVLIAVGSSPHGRGKQPPRELISRGFGLIPARAGKTITTWTRAA